MLEILFLDTNYIGNVCTINLSPPLNIKYKKSYSKNRYTSILR